MGITAQWKEFVRPYYLKWLYFHLRSGNCPACFKRWRAVPRFAIDGEAGRRLPVEGGLADFVFLPMADWHGIRQRSQQLACALGIRGHRSVYLNPHLGREFSQPYPFSPKRVATLVDPRVVELHQHLPHEPVFHHRLLSLHETAAVVEGIERLLDALGSERSVNLVSFPLWTDAAVRLKLERGSAIIYDCHDLLEGFDDVCPALVEKEAALLRAADLVVFSSARLMEQHLERTPALAGRALLLRNAVDPAEFTAAYRNPQRHSPPVIGYVGSLNSWFEVEWVKHAAAAHPEWSFRLVGLIADAFPRHSFDGCPNVHLEGEIDYSAVPGTLAEMDVVVIPFRINPLTMATNPIKLYEYFACGLPVVSSAMPEVSAFPDLVYLAADAGEFTHQLETAVAEDSAERRKRRRMVAEEESWTARAGVLSRHAMRLADAPAARGR